MSLFLSAGIFHVIFTSGALGEMKPNALVPSPATSATATVFEPPDQDAPPETRGAGSRGQNQRVPHRIQ